MAMQKSSRDATVNGIKALDMARSGVNRIRTDVDSTGARLMTGYRGVDGGEFQKLLAQWDEQAAIIAKNIKDVMEELNNTLAKHGETQRTITEWVGSGSRQATAVFDTLSN
ncbi:hypothetical protein [Streptomyces sp. NBC_00328]|uniref:hypothetical protein n=1 Tax=Streptomyces sp. NBC_00328 TaxID=2903646 RepID=UPI002E2D9082|nr:hypothetical protein [Streptomyces sp. NBC_00328]